MSEKNLFAWFQKGIYEKYREASHFNRIENRLSPGAPDVECCVGGEQFWLELKHSPEPKFSTTPIRIRFQELQPLWFRKRYLAGGKAFILLQVGKSRFLIPTFQWKKLQLGCASFVIQQMSLTGPNERPAAMLQRIKEIDPHDPDYYVHV